MTPAARVTSGVVGGVGAALLLWHLFIGFAFSTLLPEALTPEERRSIILDRLFVQPPMPIVMSVTYAVLNGLLLLCVKAKANPPTFWKHTLRHLLMSSVLAVGLIALLLLPVLISF
jgi:hypothetical protein